MPKANVGLTDDQSKAVVALLRKTLADEFVLYLKTRNYHWNVTGPHFNDLHKFFESQYEQLDEKIDDTAEAIRWFGAGAPGSMVDMLAETRLKEDTGTAVPAVQMVKSLLADHEALIGNLRSDLDAAANAGAADVADYLTGLLEDHEKMAWMLRSIAEG
jgi:starvation-inducible DNA-binding protein